jgi:hypothetical protein
MIKTKKGFDLPFSWIFAIIAGAFILLIAIYASVRLIENSKYTQYSEAAQIISNELNPVSNGITSAYYKRVDLKKETRVYLECSASSSSSPFFGKESISFSEESGLIKKWSEPGAEISRYNKYIFSENLSQGKTIYIFSKPFFTGYRVDDLVFMSMNSYCFIAPPSEIEEEISGLNPANINLTSKIDLCQKNTIKVCFDQSYSGCDMAIFGTCNDVSCKSQYETGYITKKGKTLQFFGNLLYAGIFSSADIYECNVKRLSKKTNELAKVYQEKIDVVKTKNCNSMIGNYLDSIIVLTTNMSSSLKFLEVYDKSKEMDAISCKEDCKIYAPESCI